MERLRVHLERLWARASYAGWWPAPLFFAPLVATFFWLVIRYRGLAFLDANPGLFYSGCMDDCKSDLNDHLDSAKDEQKLKSLFVSSDWSAPKRVASFEKFMNSARLCYPIIIKPNKGLRSLGVKTIYSRIEAVEYLENAVCDVLVQEFCSYKNEATIYFYQDPETLEMRIYSVALKCHATLVGDGFSTIEELLDRHPTMKYVKKTIDHEVEPDWEKVLKLGETFEPQDPPSVTIGSLIYDARDMITPEMKAWLTPICERLFEKNIFIGRFDIKYGEKSALQTGQGLKFLELNGVSAEAIHLYDRKYTPLEALGIYIQQLHLGFRIGYENQRKSRVGETSFLGFFVEALRFFKSKQSLIEMDEMRLETRAWNQVLKPDNASAPESAPTVSPAI